MEYIKIGQIVKTHSLDGSVKANMYTETLDDIKKYNIYLNIGLSKDSYKKMNLVNVRKIKNQLILNFEDITTVEEAQKLKNKYIYITDEEMREKNVLNQNEYFIKDLIGLDVYDENNNLVGKISEVLELATDVYVIKQENKKDLLIPAIKEFIKEINIKEKTMKVKIGNLNEI